MGKSKAKQTQSKVKSKIEAIKKINDSPTQTIGDTFDIFKTKTSLENGAIARKVDDYKDKTKAKKTEVTNVLSSLLDTVEGFLGTDENSNDSPLVQKKLVRYAKDSASDTLKSAKQILMDAVQNKLFAGDNVCGVNNEMPEDLIEISPKEFDFFDMLKIAPDTTMGSIMYETDVDTGFIKMNKEFYNTFDNGTYSFTKNDGDELFNLSWDDTLQKYYITGLTQTTGVTVANFIREYYSTIEQVDIDTTLKQAMSMTIQGDGTESETYIIRMDWLNRLLDKVFSICGQKQTDENLNQNDVNLIGEEEIDLDWYFNFDDVEGIDIDDEDARRRGVLKFESCDNFETPIDKSHIEDFVYFINKEAVTNSEDMVSSTLNSIATEAADDSDDKFSVNDLEISLNFKYILNTAKALVAGVISPKLMFPIVVSYKSLKGLELSADEILKQLKNLFFEVIKNIFWKFLQGIWDFIKRDLLKFLQDTAITILTNKLKRYKSILSALISLLEQVLNTDLQSCEEIFEAILSVIEGALSSKTNLPIPSVLLSFSDQLAGYSTDRAYMNVVEKLSAAGVDMEPIYGVENKTHSLVKSVIDGNSEEIDDNSYVKIALKQTIIPSGPGGAVITPLVSGVGKLF